MIHKDNFKAFLRNLDFEETGDIFNKKFTNNKTLLSVDFQKETLIYPESDGLIINERQTCNFSSAENFVVFECVHRLLEKGYNPKHLELEPKWKVGHGASGGRADILVKNQDDKPLLIIECKTAGAEFEKEKKKMQTNGGQLFSYLQQEGGTNYVCLYASTYENETIQYENAIVKIIDRKEDIEAYKNGDESIKLFKNADNNRELFEVWKETFNLYFHYNGIFEDDIQSYKIELKPLKNKDLKPLEEAAGTFNTFMEILRHNNISDNANAFNRILSLLLCKIVDEAKDDNEVLDFQVKEGEDEPELIQDRLQKLYAKGMKEYLGEEIVYFEDKEITDIIKLYPKQTPIEKIEDVFKQIKYYTHNEFAIKEVHNKALFNQNARVLNEVIKMLQNFRFRYSKKQQMLGDFFELLLNHGVKQSEGQFFTPIPIVRFIILSMGLERIIENKIANDEEKFLPKILDFACGSGHFLTESIDELQHYMQNIQTTKTDNKKIQANVEDYKQSTQWAKEYIFGIEKDYRLARTSQIACFLNGDGDANIIFGDGLENHDRLQLQTRFDIVIANPPYAIKGFKNYLKINENDYSLYEHLSESAQEIETLFCERTAQVLKTGGKAGIILPSPLLSNKGIDTKAREIILENFEIKSICELGYKTFGATPTNTIVLFLQKRDDAFKKDRKYIADDVFSGIEREANLEHIKSDALLEKYLKARDLKKTDYQTFIERNANDNMKETPMYRAYKNCFDDLPEIRKIQEKKITEQYSEDDKQQALEMKFYNYVLEKEREKFYYFMLTLNGEHMPQEVVLIQTGEKNIEKQFLGYEYSARKGAEGIKIARDHNGKMTTKLYDDDNHHNPTKANSYILKSFYNEPIGIIDESLREHIKTTTLSNMLDFENVVFEKQISLSSKRDVNISSTWEMVKLGDVAEIIKGVTYSKNDEVYEKTKNIILTADNITLEGNFVIKKEIYLSSTYKIDKLKQLKKEDVFICFASGSLNHLGKVAYIQENTTYFAGGFMGIIRTHNTHSKYLYEILNNKEFREIIKAQGTGSNIKNLTSAIGLLKIPLPPKEVQEQIVAECETIDQASKKAQQTIDEAKKEIEASVKVILNNSNIKEIKIGDLAETSSGGTPLSKENKYYLNGTIPWVNSGEVSKGDIYDSAHFITELGLQQSSAKLFPKETVLLAMYGATAGKVGVLKIQASTNQAVCGIMPNNQYISKFLSIQLQSMYDYLLGLRTGVARDNLSQAKIKNIKVKIPPLSEQKKLVRIVEKLEQTIHQAQEIIEKAPEQKQYIMDRYLK